HTLRVTVVSGRDNQFTVTREKQITVADAELTALGRSFHPEQGVPYDGVVFRFTDANRYSPRSHFSVTVDWGDASTGGPLTIHSFANGVFEVTGSHTYDTAGTYEVAVTVTDIDGSYSEAISNAQVTDAPLTGRGVDFTVNEGQSYTAP